MRRQQRWLAASALALAASPLLAPELLAFPHHRQVADKSAHPVKPPEGSAIEQVIARANRLVAASPLAREAEPRRFLLTDGGWRWHRLALGSSSAFALSRPLGEPIVVNRSDLAADRVRNGANLGGTRTLSGTIAHATAHGLIRRRFGLGSALFPQRLVEGYAGHLAQESSHKAADIAAPEAAKATHPAQSHYHGRRAVVRLLAANRGSVAELFESPR